MVDWPGLLKWSLTQTDGTVPNPDVKPMDESDRKWLQEALESYTFDEAKRVNEIIQGLIKPENKVEPNDEEQRVVYTEELADLVEGLETARDLVRMGIYASLLNVMLNSGYTDVRKGMYYVFSSCNGNNQFVQETSLTQGGLQLINSIIKEETTANKEAAFAALTSMIRGESLKVKRAFIDVDGVEFLLEILSNDKANYSNKMKIKAMTLLNDLVFYDDKFEYVDMITFNKSDGVEAKIVNNKASQHISLDGKTSTEEVKEAKQVGSSTKVPDKLSEYKHVVKKRLLEKDFFQVGLKYLERSNLKVFMDLRAAYFLIATSLCQFSPNSKPSQTYFDKVNDFKDYLGKESKSQDNIFESELEVLKNLSSL